MRTSSPTPFWSIVSNGLRFSSPASRYAGIIRLSTSSRLNPNVIWVRSFVPKLKKSATSASSSARRAARGVSIIVPMVTLGRFALRPFGEGRELMSDSTSSTQPRASASSSRVTVSGIMISTIGS